MLNQSSHWPLSWSHGSATVQALGGMLAPVHFSLPGGRVVQPFAVAPWVDENPPAGELPLQGLMAGLRGEWPCVPFGLNPDPHALGWPHEIHGDSSHGLWRRIDDASDAALLRLRFEPSAAGPVEFLERQVRGVPGQAALDCVLRVQVRRPCALPVGLHPTLRLPQRPGALRVAPGRFAFARSYPQPVEPGADPVAPGREFAQLSAVPGVGGDGDALDMSQLPLAQRCESLLMLCGVDGCMDAINTDEGYRFSLRWDAAQLPSCMLWISNGGRRQWPWSQRHFALGIEPVCSFFDLGVQASTQPGNPVAARGVPTALQFNPGEPVELHYRMAVHPWEA